MSQTATLNQNAVDYPALDRGSRLLAMIGKMRFIKADRRLSRADLPDQVNSTFDRYSAQASTSRPPQLDRFLQRIDR